MKQKKYGVLLLTTVVALSAALAACGGGSADSSGSSKGGSDNAKQVTIRVWGDLSNQAVLEEPYKKINEAFAAKHPNIKVQYDFAQNDQSLNVALQANELPDLFIVQGNKTPKMKEMVTQGFLLPLDDYKLDLSRYSAEEIEYGTVDGKLYSSLPSFTDTQLVYFNKALFEKHGVAVPANFDEFVAALDTFTKAGVTAIAMPGRAEWDRSWLVYALQSALANDSLKGVLSGANKVADPAIAEAFQYIRDFAEAGYFGRDFIANDMAAAQFAFTNGNAAMIVDGTWNNPTYASSGLDVGRFIVPNKEGTRIAAASYSNFMTYAVSSKSEHPDAAVKYIEFLNTQEAQQIMEDANGLVPTIKDIVPKSEEVKELAQFDESGPAVYSVMAALASESANTADIMMKEVIPMLLTSEMTGEAAAARLDASATYPQ